MIGLAAALLITNNLGGWVGCAQGAHAPLETSKGRPVSDPAAHTEQAMEEPKRMTSEMLEVRLTTEGPRKAGQSIRIRMIVSNPTGQTHAFCKYHTAFEGLQNDIFSVRTSGHEVEYRGVMKKRAEPGPEDYVHVAPGASVEAVVDLSEGYAFAAGDYEVSYRGTRISGLKSSPTLALTIEP